METVDTELGTLRPTLGAAMKVTKRFGSFMDALRKVESLDLEAFVFIVAAGLNKRPVDVEESVYDVGTMALVQPVSDFVTLLANGGKPIKAAAQDGSAPGE